MVAHDELEAPELGLPYRRHTSGFGWREPLAIAAGVALVAGAVLSPITGTSVGLATGFVLRVPQTRIWFGIAGACSLPATGNCVVGLQGNDHVSPVLGWPLQLRQDRN